MTNYIRIYRTRLKLSVPELAAFLLVDAETVYRWERGETKPIFAVELLLKHLAEKEESDNAKWGGGRKEEGGGER